MGLLNWIPFLGRKKVAELEPQPTVTDDYFVLTITMDPNGRIRSFAHIPSPPDEQVVGCCDNIAQLIHAASKGRLEPSFIRAVAKAGEDGDLQDFMSQVVISKLAELGRHGQDDETALVVRPSQVFGVPDND